MIRKIRIIRLDSREKTRVGKEMKIIVSPKIMGSVTCLLKLII